MSLTNGVGNYMVAKSISNGHVALEIYKDETSFQAYKTEPTAENEPMRSNIYIGTKFDDVQKTVTSLDGLTLAERLQKLLEEVLVQALAENYSILPRSKFEQSDWTVIV